MMDRFTTLQPFVRVMETGSFSKAANDLGLTQPTVTKHVSTIEHRLGVRLLNRNSRGISLTEIGSLYFERCKVVLREVEAALTHRRPGCISLCAWRRFEGEWWQGPRVALGNSHDAFMAGMVLPRLTFR
jgi:DNA-binding transcriptional LysR family regulator